MPMSDILTHVDAGVMTLTFNRLEKKNSITSAMYGVMADALAQAPVVACGDRQPAAGDQPALRVEMGEMQVGLGV